MPDDDTITTVAHGDRIEYDDGRVWRILNTSACAVYLALSDANPLWPDCDSLQTQLADELGTYCRGDAA
jgi:hypothetical protein